MDNLKERLLKLSPEKRALLERKLQNKAAAAAVQSIARRNGAEPAPLSFAQQRLWFLDQLEPGSAFYHLPSILQLKGILNPAALEGSLREIVRRHEVLRTNIQVVDGEPSQVISALDRFRLPLTDLSPLPEITRQSEMQRLAREENSQPFNLASDAMIRGRLIRMAEDEHVLVLTMHHIAADGWSYGIFWREIAAIYTAIESGQPSPLPELPIQYADYAVWQRAWLQGDTLHQQLTYWKERLTGAPVVLELPSDHPRPALQSYRGARQSITLNQELVESLQDLSRRAGATLYMTLLAAWKILLSRYSGQFDLVVGSPIAGRNRNELEGLIGCFVNTLALRTDLSGNPTFQELLLRVKETTLGAYEHQDLPFEKLVEELDPERSLNHSPIVQVMLVLQNTPQRSRELGELQITRLEVEIDTAKFDLTLTFFEGAKGLWGSLEYSTDLFEPNTIARMIGHFQQLLAGIVAKPETPIEELPLITPDEQQQLIAANNATQVALPGDRELHELIEQRAIHSPNAVAVEFYQERLTYGELNHRANQLAHQLRKLGVSSDVLVGVYLERSPRILVALLAIMKAGGAYVPLDPAYPTERLAYMLQDADVSILLTESGLVAKLPEHRAQVLCIDQSYSEPAEDTHAIEHKPLSIDRLAYVIYTSGSTGKPKGIEIEHRALLNLLQGMQQLFTLNADDALLAVTTLSFDIAALELFLPLMVGARIVLADRASAADGNKLAELIARKEISILQATPITWRLLLQAGWQGSSRLTMLVGGEALPLDLARELVTRGRALWNLYGPTETTVWSTAWHVPEQVAAISIGKPIANTEIYILDQHHQLVPSGIAGELYIGGTGLARGYRHRPELTQERFIPHPFAAAQHQRLYRTGDLARWRSNGELEYLGRADFQVKLRGHRIELGEIEAVLRDSPNIRDAVVAIRGEAGHERLVGYIVPHDSKLVSITELRKTLAQQLPVYMVPTSFVALAELPLTPNGKIDHKALQARDVHRTESEQVDDAPHT